MDIKTKDVMYALEEDIFGDVAWHKRDMVNLGSCKKPNEKIKQEIGFNL